MAGETAEADVATWAIPRLELIICTPTSRSASVRLAERIEEAISLRPGHVIVDLAACDSLDATAIGVLLDAHRRVRRYGGQLSLRGATARVRRMLHLAGAEHVFDMLPPVDAGPLP